MDDPSPVRVLLIPPPRREVIVSWIFWAHEGLEIASSSSPRVNQKTAARDLGITVKTLQTWQDEPWFPKNGRTKTGYSVAIIRKARDQIGRKGSDDDDDERARRAKIEKIESEARIRAADARERERNEQIALGNLLPRDEYEAALVEILTVTRDRLLTLPGRLSKLPSVKDRRKHKLESAREIEKILTAFSGDIEHIEHRVRS